MIKRFLANALRAFFVEESTFYSVYVVTANGTKPLCQWFRGLNPPRTGEYIAVVTDETKDSIKTEREFIYYKVLSVTTIFNPTKFDKKNVISGKKEGTILVQYKGKENPIM